MVDVLRGGLLPPVITDMGTGSGAIAIALATQLPAARIYAIDSSAAALAVARRNAARHEADGRITFLKGDLLAPLPQRVDAIAANLPYVTTADWQALPPEIRDHEPRGALDGGADGLDVIRRMLERAPAHLLPGGAVCLEFGVGQEDALVGYARRFFGTAAVLPDLGGRPRVLIAR